MNKPNFLIIGALKAGTTSLFNYLMQHPQIYMSPVKEPKFFALVGEYLDPKKREILGKCVVDIEEYRALFDNVTTEKAIGEASAIYLSSRRAPGRIQHYILNVKLIAILRDPVERAYSHFLHNVRKYVVYAW